MNLVIDFGNTRIKAAVFSGTKLHEKFLFSTSQQLKSFLEKEKFEHCIVSSVNEPTEEVVSWITCGGKKLLLTTNLPLPVNIAYATPDRKSVV